MRGDAADEASLALLRHTTGQLALIKGPISSGTATAALTAVAAVVRARHQPITPKERDAIMALIEAVREDIEA